MSSTFSSPRASSRRIAFLLALLAVCPALAQSPPCPEKIKALNAARDDLFGCAVALSDGLLVVGALGTDARGTDSGSAYVLAREPAGWTQVEEIFGSNTQAGDQFGYSVAAGGADLVVVGAPFESYLAFAAGGVYIFGCSARSCREMAHFPSSSSQPGGQLGFAVAVDHEADRETTAAGAPGGGGPGHAEIFERLTGTAEPGWLRRKTLVAAGGADGDGFGFSVALSQGVLLVGAPFADGSIGAVYVAERLDGNWTVTGELPRPALRPGDLFGYAVAMDGPTALVGVPRQGGGAAYVFTLDGNAWRYQDELRPMGRASRGLFGVSAAVAGDRALVGARDDDAAYVFQRQGTRWTPRAGLAAGDRGAPGDAFGLGTALGPGLALAGAFRDDFGGRDSGAVYSFSLDVGGAQSCEPDFALAVSGPLSLEVGDVVTYTLRVTNGGGVAAPATLDAPAPNGLTLQSAGAPCGEGFPCDLGRIEAGGGRTVTASYAVGEAVCSEPEITYEAWVTGDAETSNNHDAVTATVDSTPTPALGLSGPSAALAGEEVTFTLRPSNQGGCPATGLRLDAPAPPGLTLLRADAPCGDLPCSLPDLAGGISRRIDATYLIDPALKPHRLTLRAVLSSPGESLEKRASVDVGHLVRLELVPVGLSERGASIVSFALVNRGPSTLVGGLFEFSFPPGILFPPGGTPGVLLGTTILFKTSIPPRRSLDVTLIFAGGVAPVPVTISVFDPLSGSAGAIFRETVIVPPPSGLLDGLELGRAVGDGLAAQGPQLLGIEIAPGDGAGRSQEHFGAQLPEEEAAIAGGGQAITAGAEGGGTNGAYDRR